MPAAAKDKSNSDQAPGHAAGPQREDSSSPGRAKGNVNRKDDSGARGAEDASAGRSAAARERGPDTHRADTATADSQSRSQSNGKAKGHDKAQDRSHRGPNGSNANATGTATAQGRPSESGTAKEDTSSAQVRGSGTAPAGNKGSMKVRPVGTAAHPPRNYAHLPCTVQVDFYGSPHAGATLTARSHAPTSPTGQTLLTDTVAFSSSSANPRGNELVGSTTLDFSEAVEGLTYHPQQGYHIKLTAEQDGPQGADVKHKVFWIDCVTTAHQLAPQDTAVGETGADDTTDDESGADKVADDDAELAEQPNTEVLGVTVDREVEVEGGESPQILAAADAGEPADGRFLGAGGALVGGVAAIGGALAATGVPALLLAAMALAAVGAGTGLVRRTRRR